MRTNHIPNGPSPLVDTSAIWLLSFGDLLTLLTCSLLLLTPNFIASQRTRPTKEPLSTPTHAEVLDGTYLATQELGSPRTLNAVIPVTIATSAKDRRAAVVMETQAAFNVIRGRPQAEFDQLRIKVCNKGGDAEELETLVSKLDSMHDKRGVFEVDLMAGCDKASLGVSPERELIAVVEFS